MPPCPIWQRRMVLFFPGCHIWTPPFLSGTQFYVLIFLSGFCARKKKPSTNLYLNPKLWKNAHLFVTPRRFICDTLQKKNSFEYGYATPGKELHYLWLLFDVLQLVISCVMTITRSKSYVYFMSLSSSLTCCIHCYTIRGVLLADMSRRVEHQKQNETDSRKLPFWFLFVFKPIF